MKIIKLTRPDGVPVYVVVSSIYYWTLDPVAAGVTKVSFGGIFQDVLETPEVIEALVTGLGLH